MGDSPRSTEVLMGDSPRSTGIAAPPPNIPNVSNELSADVPYVVSIFNPQSQLIN